MEVAECGHRGNVVFISRARRLRHQVRRSGSEHNLMCRVVYVRFHGPAKYTGSYDDRVLNDWAEWLAAQMRHGFEPPGSAASATYRLPADP